MVLSKSKIAPLVLLTLGLVATGAGLCLEQALAAQQSSGPADKRAPTLADDLSPAQFAKLHKLISRQAGEQKYLEINWMPSPREAQKKAAAEGKPLLVFSQQGDAMAQL
jgi:hypothetical protein